MKLRNKRIVLTGGTSGVGYEMAKYLYQDNEVLVISRDKQKLRNLARELEGIKIYQADLSMPRDVETIAYAIMNDFESIDVLINNAAVQYTPAFTSDAFDYGSISLEMSLNFTSVCCLTSLLLPVLTHENKAVILNINSGLALVPKTSSAVYCASKAALNSFSQSLRYQLEDSNICVQQAFLELVDTAMTEGRGNNKMSAEEAAALTIKGVEHNIQEHDIGRVKLLRLLLRIAPSIARRIMKKN